MKYYIVQNDEKTGPYDLLTMIRRVRSGAVTKDTVLLDETGQSKKAAEFPEIAEILEETDAPQHAMTIGQKRLDFEFSKLMNNGSRFLQLNIASMAYAGLAMAMTLLLGVLLSRIYIVGYVLAFVVGFLFFAAYLLYVLKLNRGQHVDLHYVVRKIFENIVALSITGLVVSILFSASVSLSLSVSPWFVILIIPGLFITAIFIFAPLLIIERHMDFASAMGESKRKVLSLRTDDIGILFGLMVINFTAAVCFVMPLVASLPITSSALTEMYDELFNTP